MISLLLALGAAAGRQSSPSLNEQQKINQAATSVALNMVANMMKIPEDGSRARRAQQTQYTSCTTCLAANYYWNGFQCHDTKTYSNFHFALWGPAGSGYETDCSKATGITTMLYDDIMCGEDWDNLQTCTSSSTTGSQTVNAVYIKIAIPSDMTMPTDNNDACAILDQATVDMVKARFSASKGADDPGFPYLDQQFARVKKGEWSKTTMSGCPGASQSFTISRSLAALDAVYKIDKATCPNGVDVTSGSGCTPTDLTGWQEFKDTNFRLTAFSQKAANIWEYSFCYTDTTKSGCIHVQLPKFIKSGTTGTSSASTTVAKNVNSFDCAGRSHSLGLLDIEWAFDFRSITYDGGSNARYGFRILTTQQTGSLVATDTENNDSDLELVSKSGFMTLDLEKSMLYDNAGSASCSSSRDANMLKYSKSKLNIVGSSTSCGTSTIFTPAWKSSRESEGFDNILCHFASFYTTSQYNNIYWDPKNSVDADLAASSQSSSSAGAHSVAPALAAFAAAILLSLLA